MNEHDMISNISYIMRSYPETTEEILIKHGADLRKEYWTDGCDVASAYEELLQWLNSRYDRNDPETELDYHIQEILGWHDVNEATQLDESNNVMSDQKYISAFLRSVDDPSQFLSARLQKSITVNCYLNTAKFSDGAPVLKYFYRGKFTTLYDRTIGRGRWIIIDPDSYGYVYDAKNSGWLQFQLHSSEHASCLSTSVLKKLSELTGDYSWFDTDTDSNISESVASNIEIPAPYNQYYEFSPNKVNFDELPDAFDHYKELKVIAELYAKEQYEDALANNCLDFCWLVEDEIGKLLLVTTAGLRVYPITLEEIQDCVDDGSSDNYFDFDEGYTGEPSSTEYGDAMSRYFREMTNAIEKYNIRKIGRKRSIEYDGVVNGHKFFFVEGNTGTGHYAKELYIDGKEVNLYQSKESERSFAYLNEMNQFGILSLVKMLENDNLSGIVYRDVDTLDDYEESLVEDVEMSDAQRLALQELDSCLEYGELTAEQHALAYQIQWDINFEDVLLFINGIDADLKDIKHVEYGDCDETKFDGCYSVTFQNGDVKKYGWHDFDMTGSLTCIDCNESVQSNEEGAYQVYKVGKNGKFTALLKLFDTPHEADEYAATLDVPTKVVYVPQTLIENVEDGWDKPFDWTERYVKDGFVIFNNYQGAWHLEQTRPKTKHIGNYKSLEAAKAAGDAEINKRNAKNKDKPVQFGVHSFTSDSIVFRGTEDECAEYINKNGLENEAEIYMMNANDRHYLDEAAGKRFNNGDRVYVTVNNRQGTVTKMVSDDVVEVEFEANGTYPARIDRFYTDEVKLIFPDDLDDDF